MARYVLKNGLNLFKNGNNIFTTNDTPVPPIVDIDPHRMDLADGARPEIITDYSGNNTNAFQNDPLKRGTFRRGIAKGSRHAFETNGVDQWYQFAQILRTATVFVVAKPLVASHRGGLFGNSSGQWQWVGNQRAANIWIHSNMGLDGSNDLNTAMVAEYRYNRLFYNGVRQVGFYDAVKTLTWNLLAIDIHHRNVTGIDHIGVDGRNTNRYEYFGNFQYARILVYDYRMTQAHRDAKINELMEIYI